MSNVEGAFEGRATLVEPPSLGRFSLAIFHLNTFYVNWYIDLPWVVGLHLQELDIKETCQKDA